MNLSIETQAQFLKFLIVGLVNTLVGYSLYALLIYCGLDYALALFFATLLGLFFNFYSTGFIVFKNQGFSRLSRFVAVYGFTYCINLSLIKGLESFITNKYLAGFCVLLPVAVLTFVLNKFLVFKDTHETH